MQVQDYCKAMLAEVTAWKEKLEAMKKVADSYGTEQKEKVATWLLAKLAVSRNSEERLRPLLQA
ncbi:MAG: hypothetical protein P8X80_16640 [Desulfobacterales bacterium]